MVCLSVKQMVCQSANQMVYPSIKYMVCLLACTSCGIFAFRSNAMIPYISNCIFAYKANGMLDYTIKACTIDHIISSRLHYNLNTLLLYIVFPIIQGF